jgi:hypothetical protein
MKAACAIVLHEGRNRQLIRLDDGMLGANFLGRTRGGVQLGGWIGRRDRCDSDCACSEFVMRDFQDKGAVDAAGKGDEGGLHVGDKVAEAFDFIG